APIAAAGYPAPWGILLGLPLARFVILGAWPPKRPGAGPVPRSPAWRGRTWTTTASARKPPRCCAGPSDSTGGAGPCLTPRPTRHRGSNPIISGALRPFFRMLPNAARPSPAGHAGRPVTTLSAATGGDLHRNRLWRDLLGPGGAGDGMQVRLAAGGATWAHLD